MNRLVSTATLILSTLVFITNLFASAGDFDWSFGAGGKTFSDYGGSGSDYAQSVAVQPDGKILVAATTNEPPNSYRHSIIRYHANGTLDMTFGTNGKVSFGGFSFVAENEIALQTDGKIVLGRMLFVPVGSGTRGRFALNRLNADGSIDMTFGGGDGEMIFPAFVSENHNDELTDIALQADGKIVATGYTSESVTNGRFAATLRANPDGSLDNSFGYVSIPIGSQGSTGAVNSVAIQPDGKIVVAGFMPTPNFTTSLLIIRYNSNGTLDTSFEGDGIVSNLFGTNYIYDVALQADGKIVVAGHTFIGTPSASAFFAARFNPNGSTDTSFDGDGAAAIEFAGSNGTFSRNCIVQPNGKIIVSGSARYNTYPTFAVVRLNPNGALDTSFNGSGKILTLLGNEPTTGFYENLINDMVLQPDGKLLVVGKTGPPAPSQIVLARFLMSGWQNPDFDSDANSDISVFRPETGVWYWLNSLNNSFAAYQFGVGTDKIAPADYDGDGRTDLAVFRDGTWFVLQSSNGGVVITQFGLSNDKPVSADYDGDGRVDLAVFRGGVWHILNSGGGGYRAEQFGIAADKPLVGDFDGDGKSDLAVYRDGVWYINHSSSGFLAFQFGLADDKPVAADYDADGKTDIAVYRPADNVWYLQQSFGGFRSVAFGAAGDKPVPADYDYDGKADVAVYRAGIWYIRQSTGSVRTVQFGAANDTPVPSAFLP